MRGFSIMVRVDEPAVLFGLDVGIEAYGHSRDEERNL
jgi:hypothetical protein